MPLSELTGSYRSPGIQVVANGQQVTGVMAANVRSNNYFGADCFELRIALTTDAAFWAGAASIDVDIRFRDNALSRWMSIIQGRADSVRLDPIRRSVEVEGRDYSASLIDSVVSETFTNRTAGEIATLIAQRHGLQPLVTPTSAVVGRYYQNQHDSVLLDSFCGRASEWDLLCYLAQRENFDLFVAGTALNFVPAATAAVAPIVIGPGSLIGLHLNRTLALTGEVEVVVKTWSSRQHAADVQTARAARNTGAGSSAGAAAEPRRYVLVRPNLASDEAARLAHTKLAELCAHGRSVDLVMPGELALTPRTPFVLSGTGTSFDQLYRIEMIDRIYSSATGFVQRVRATGLLDQTAAR